MVPPEYPLNSRAHRGTPVQNQVSAWTWFELSSIFGLMLVLSTAALNPLSDSRSPQELLQALPASLAALSALLCLIWLTRHFVGWFWRKRARYTVSLAVAMSASPLALLAGLIQLQEQAAVDATQEQLHLDVASTLAASALMMCALCFVTWRAARLIPGQAEARPPRSLWVRLIPLVSAAASLSLLGLMSLMAASLSPAGS